MKPGYTKQGCQYTYSDVYWQPFFMPGCQDKVSDRIIINPEIL